MSNQLYTKNEVDAIVAGLGTQFARATTASDPLGSTGVASVDARNENRPPQDYYNLGKGFVQEFKFQKVLGLSTDTSYCHLFSFIP